jgi:hypothetical protein
MENYLPSEAGDNFVADSQHISFMEAEFGDSKASLRKEGDGSLRAA